MNKTSDALFPVAEITSGPLPSLDVVLIRFDFLTHSMQPVSEATPGRNYALTKAQAHYLVQKIQSALQILESAESQAPGGLMN